MANFTVVGQQYERTYRDPPEKMDSSCLAFQGHSRS